MTARERTVDPNKYRTEREQHAIARLEQAVKSARERHATTIYFPILAGEVTDIERVLLLVRSLEDELNYREVVGGKDWWK